MLEDPYTPARLGNLDLPTLRATMYPFTLETLANYSAIDPDPFTTTIAQIICSQLPRSKPAPEDLSQHPHPIIRGLVATEALSIYSALSGYFDEDGVVDVLVELAKRTEIDDHLAPAVKD